MYEQSYISAESSNWWDALTWTETHPEQSQKWWHLSFSSDVSNCTAALTALQTNTIWVDVHSKLMSRAGLFGNSPWSFSMQTCRAWFLSPVCLSSPSLSVCWLCELSWCQLEPWQHWRCCSLSDRGTHTNYWFFPLFIVNKDPKGSKKFFLFGPSVFLPFLCLFPLLALFSVIPSAPSPSLGEPGNSTGASWALLFLKNFLLPPVLLLVLCNSQFLFALAKVLGL